MAETVVGPRERVAACGVALLVLSLALPAGGADREVGPGCAPGAVVEAAEELVGRGADVVEEQRVADLDTALVLEPTMVPPVRHRLLRAGDLWCDVTGFNTAWSVAGTGGALAAAAAFASVAAAPYFDDVTVVAARPRGVGAVEVDTHASTNGVTATWRIEVDRHGVRRARWAATGFAVEPFTPRPRGLTALPGGTRSYERTGEGRVTQVEPLLDLSVFDEPSLHTEVEMSDGFVVEVRLSETEYGPDPGEDTGLTPVDYVRMMRDAAEDNYTAFLDWGFEGRWTSDRGTVYVDDTTAVTCLACVRLTDEFNVHMSLQLRPTFTALGYHYPDASDYDVVNSVMGHEIFHNFQTAYGGRTRDGARSHQSFTEGTARMQEVLHHYSAISHQPESLVYADDGNGCNGFKRVQYEPPSVWWLLDVAAGPLADDLEAAMAGGPFSGHSYDACYFWLTFHGARGTGALVDVVDALYDHAFVAGPDEQIFAMIEQATGEPIATDLAAFAAASLSGHGYTFPAADGTGDALDWGQHLDRWEPAPLAPGDVRLGPAGPGGMLAGEVVTGGSARVEGPAAELYAVRSLETGVDIRSLGVGGHVDPPQAGERVWVVAINARPADGFLTMRFTKE